MKMYLGVLADLGALATLGDFATLGALLATCDLRGFLVAGCLLGLVGVFLREAIEVKG